MLKERDLDRMNVSNLVVTVFLPGKAAVLARCHLYSDNLPAAVLVRFYDKERVLLGTGGLT